MKRYGGLATVFRAASSGCCSVLHFHVTLSCVDQADIYGFRIATILQEWYQMEGPE